MVSIVAPSSSRRAIRASRASTAAARSARTRSPPLEQHVVFARARLCAGARGKQLAAPFGKRRVLLRKLLCKRGRLLLRRSGLLLPLRLLARELPERLLQRGEALLPAGVAVEEQIDLKVAQLVAQLQIGAGLGALLFQRLQAAVQLRKDILQPLEVLARMLELALRLLLAHAVAHDARRLLERGAAFVGFVGQYLVHAALADDGIAVAGRRPYRGTSLRCPGGGRGCG